MPISELQYVADRIVCFTTSKHRKQIYHNMMLFRKKLTGSNSNLISRWLIVYHPMFTLFTSYTEGLPPAVSRCLHVILIVYQLMFTLFTRYTDCLPPDVSRCWPIRLTHAKTVQDSVLLKKEQTWCL